MHITSGNFPSFCFSVLYGTVEAPEPLTCGSLCLPMTEKIPSVVIVGRPNVGKSTIFNRLTGTRRSIVTDEPGITRDRIYGTATWQGRTFEVVDTGGIVPDDKAAIPREILRQAQGAIEAETQRQESLAAPFYELSNDVFPISAEHGYGFDTLLEAITPSDGLQV